MKLSKFIVLIIRIVLAAEFVTAIIMGEYLNAFTALLAFILSMFPAVMVSRGRLRLSSGIQCVIIVFIFASMYLGEIRGYYDKFLWWDVMLHSISGVILGLIGFLLVNTLNEHTSVTLSPFFVALFAFTFAVTAGTLWEIYEYAMDQIFHMNMQKDGLNDTMWDLICDTLSALLTSVAGYVLSHRQLGESNKKTTHDE